jgi:predicted AlkP superfamily phosphohydrolase/phosphomutase
MKREGNDYYGRLTTSKDLKRETLWKLLSDFGKKSIVINVTGTYPPEKIDGVIISGGLDTPEGVIFTHPPQLTEKLKKMNYIKFVDPEITDSDIIFEKLLKMETKRKCISSILMKEYQWDFFMTLFIGTDFIQHKLWNERENINRYYQEMDNILGDLLEEVDNNTSVIVISDHGFGALKKLFNVNKWLFDLGLLQYKKVNIESTRSYKVSKLKINDNKTLKDHIFSKMGKIGITQETIIYLFKKLGSEKMKNYLPDNIREMINRKLLIFLPTNVDIDWSNTQAFLSSFFGTGTQSITINVKGRETEGVVPPEEYENLRNFIIENLRKVKDPSTGNPILMHVYKREELYHGPYIEEAADITMYLKGEYQPSNSLKTKSIITPLKRISGAHRLYGVFIAKGPHIKQDERIKNVEIIDFTPTILHILGVPIPKDADGRVLTEIFEEDSDLAKKPITYQKIDEEERIKEKIKELKFFGKI